MQDPVPKMAKFWFLYARPGNRVLLYKNGDIIVCPTPLDMRLQGFRRCKLLLHSLQPDFVLDPRPQANTDEFAFHCL